MYAPVEITWWDAHALTSTWTDVTELSKEPRVIVSVGMLIPNAKPHHHVIVQSVDDTRVDQALAIPDEMVVCTRYLAGTYERTVG